MSLVHDGAHTWNRRLQTVNYFEGEMVPLGVFRMSSLNEYASAYVADNGRFVRRAVQRADEMTLVYRRKNADQFMAHSIHHDPH